MSSERWDPFREVVSLRDAMNSLLQESFVRPVGGLLSGNTTPVPLDVLETTNEFLIKASLPGVKPDDVQITVHNDTLTIQGETRADEEKPGETWLIHERRSGTFRRAVHLPAAVSSEKATARFDNGVLTLTLPKAEEAKPRQIKVGG